MQIQKNENPKISLVKNENPKISLVGIGVLCPSLQIICQHPYMYVLALLSLEVRKIVLKK